MLPLGCGRGRRQSLAGCVCVVKHGSGITSELGINLLLRVCLVIYACCVLLQIQGAALELVKLGARL